MTRRTTVVAMLMMLAGVCAAPAQAQSFPSRPIHVVVPFPPGGAADLSSRLIADQMSQGLGQPVIVDNRPGGSTVIGNEIVARSAPDGHTLLVTFPSFLISSMLRKVPYDPLKDFKAVSQVISVPMGIAVSIALPVKSFDELLALAKAKPGSIAYGTPGTGTTQHIAVEMLKQRAGVDFTHAPFQGEAPALNAVAGGHVPMALVNASAIAPFAKAGKVRALVVTTRDRADVLPDVPTYREVGFADLEVTNWAGIVVPAQTPAPVIARLNAEIVKALRNPEVQDKLKTLGMQPAPGTPEQFGAFLQSEAARYAKVVREAGIKAE